LGIARDIARFGLPLIADFKVADIPNTNRLIADQVFAAGFSSIICHAFTGRDAVQACVDSAHKNNGECYVVAEMSHPGATEFFHGGIAERLAQVALVCGTASLLLPRDRNMQKSSERLSERRRFTRQELAHREETCGQLPALSMALLSAGQSMSPAIPPLRQRSFPAIVKSSRNKRPDFLIPVKAMHIFSLLRRFVRSSIYKQPSFCDQICAHAPFRTANSILDSLHVLKVY
jgi:hypothetical protein